MTPMRHTLHAGLAALLPMTTAAQDAGPASGLAARLHEVIWDEADGPWLRLRFVAPGMTAAAPEALAADMEALCTSVGLPVLAAGGAEVERIVVSISERPVPFGASAPETAQVFDMFRPRDGACVWEPF